MQALIRRLREANAGAFAVLVLIFLGLLLEGANSAARAALLSAVLLFALGVATVASRSVARVLAANWLSIVAAAGFLALAVATALPGVLPVAAPVWSLLGDGDWPFSVSPYRTLEGAVAFLGPCAAYLAGALLTPERRARDWAGRWLVVLGVAYALIGLYQFFAVGSRTGGRLDVGVSSANAAAALFGVLALVAAALMVRAARGRLDGADRHDALPPAWRWAGFALKAPLSFAAIILLFACLLLTASRGGLLATVIAFAFFALVLASQGLKRASARGGAVLAPIVLVAIVFAVLFARGGEEVLQRFALAAEDMEVRRTLAEAHWAQFLESPLLGNGLNSYHELNTLAATPENWSALRAPGSAHNIFVQVLEETGLVGLGVWALMLATPLVRAQARIAAGHGGVEWAAAALAATLLLLLHGTVDFALQVPAIAALFAFILGASVGRSEPRKS